MDNENNFFSLNHIEHFRRGFCHNIDMEDGVMKFASDGEAVYVSHAFDTKENNTAWHRAVAYMEKAEGVWYSLAFYASNARSARFQDGVERDLDLFLEDEEISGGDKARALLEAEFWSREYIDTKDILLYELRGRYLWLKLVMTGPVFPKIFRIRLYYPQTSFVRYLPESCQTKPGSFFVRFTALFQSLYLDLDEKIADFHSELDPLTASPEALKLLVRWMGLEPFSAAGEDKLRMLAAEAAHLYRIWGTKSSLVRALMLICGERPYIQEHFGQEAFTFTVLMSDRTDRKLAVTVIEAIKPAHTNYRLVILKQSLFLDGHTYIGVNSRLSGYPPLRLDSRTAMGAHEL